MSALHVVYYILGSNLLFSFIFSLIVYIRSQKYYRPLIKKDKDNNPIDLHKKYDAFHPHDDVCFIQLWFGAFFCAFIKLFISLFIVTFGYWHLLIKRKIYKNYNTNPEHKRKLKNLISCWSWLFLAINGVRVKKKFPEYKEVYQKYLGEDYNFEDDKYSLIISNHIGFFEIVICMALYAPGFLAKSTVENYFFIGPISQSLNCLYVDRENSKDKQKIFDLLLERQQSFYEEKILSPLVLFPEGTCSCGRNILRFKKGAFYALLPIKPQIVSVDQTKSFHLSVGASNVILAYFKNLCHSINTIYVAILPTIRATDYMFEHYKSFGKEKWEIYSKVIRKIYSEIGGLEETDMGYRDLARYIRAMRTGFYDPNENMNFEKEDKSTDINDNSEKDDLLEINTKIKENNIDNKEDMKDNDNDTEKYEVKEDNNEDNKVDNNEDIKEDKNKDIKEDNDIIDENRNGAEEKLLDK